MSFRRYHKWAKLENLVHTCLYCNLMRHKIPFHNSTIGLYRYTRAGVDIIHDGIKNCNGTSVANTHPPLRIVE